MILLPYLDANTILGDNLPDQGALSTQLLSGLIEGLWVGIGAIQNSPGCAGDSIVTKPRLPGTTIYNGY